MKKMKNADSIPLISMDGLLGNLKYCLYSWTRLVIQLSWEHHSPNFSAEAGRRGLSWTNSVLSYAELHWAEKLVQRVKDLRIPFFRLVLLWHTGLFCLKNGHLIFICPHFESQMTHRNVLYISEKVFYAKKHFCLSQSSSMNIGSTIVKKA